MILRVNVAGCLGVAGRALGGVEPPEREHVAIPAPLAGCEVAFPEADAAELLRDVEQLLQAFGLVLRAAVRELPGRAFGHRMHMHREPAVADGDVLARMRRRREQQRRGQAAAEALLEGCVAPDDRAGVIGDRKQLG